MGKATRARTKWAFGTLVVVLGVIGGWLASGGCGDDRSVRRVEAHLEIIRDQLADLKDHLVAYKTAHGRYPTNDEGLAALDNFLARFKTKMVMDPIKGRGYLHALYDGRQAPGHLENSRQAIRESRIRCGRVPQDAEQFRDVVLRRYTFLMEETSDATEVEVAIGMSDNVFFLSPAGVLTPWMVPYVSENRAGLDASIFADSPANGDGQGQYSIRVDDGVYVYAIGGIGYARAYNEMWWEYRIPRIWGFGLLGMAAVCLSILVFLSWRAGLAAVGVGATGLVLALPMTATSCYVVAPLFSQRSPEMITTQRRLLEKHHSKGVISDATYQKAISALDATVPPAPKQ